MPFQRYTPRRVYRAALGRLFGNAIGTLTHVKTTESVAALTFDDGPDPASTPRVLDILARHQAPSTFFMIGEAAGRYPELVRRVADEGHAIGNHTWGHAALTRLDRPERLREIRSCEATLGACGPRLFRPPYGEQTLGARLDLLRCGYTVVTWNRDTGDWWNPDGAAIKKNLLHCVRPGSIILLHDAIHRPKEGHRSGIVSRPTQYAREAMLEGLDAALQELRPRFRFVTVPQLLRFGRPQRTLWSNWEDSPAVKH